MVKTKKCPKPGFHVFFVLFLDCLLYVSIDSGGHWWGRANSTLTSSSGPHSVDTSTAMTMSHHLSHRSWKENSNKNQRNICEIPTLDQFRFSGFLLDFYKNWVNGLDLNWFCAPEHIIQMSNSSNC